jgi:hypothetical protein
MLLAAAERRLGVCDRLAALIADPPDPSRVVHSVANILRAGTLAIAGGYGDAAAGGDAALRDLAGEMLPQLRPRLKAARRVHEAVKL